MPGSLAGAVNQGHGTGRALGSGRSGAGTGPAAPPPNPGANTGGIGLPKMPPQTFHTARYCGELKSMPVVSGIGHSLPDPTDVALGWGND